MLLISPTLAQTLGLEEALLLQLLHEMQQLQDSTDVTLTNTLRARLLPFWTPTQLGLVLTRLQAQSVIQVSGSDPWTIQLLQPQLLASEKQAALQPASVPFVDPYIAKPVNPIPVISMNEARQRNQVDDDLAYLKPNRTEFNRGRTQKTKMHLDWEPSADFPKLLSFHDIPLQFALSELAKFRQYYTSSDRSEISWDVKFVNWVQRAWHDSLNTKGRHDRQQPKDGKSPDAPQNKRTRVRDALRNIRDTDW